MVYDTGGWCSEKTSDGGVGINELEHDKHRRGVGKRDGSLQPKDGGWEIVESFKTTTIYFLREYPLARSQSSAFPVSSAYK
jgi:hypothetical protein